MRKFTCQFPLFIPSYQTCLYYIYKKNMKKKRNENFYCLIVATYDGDKKINKSNFLTQIISPKGNYQYL